LLDLRPIFFYHIFVHIRKYLYDRLGVVHS